MNFLLMASKTYWLQCCWIMLQKTSKQNWCLTQSKSKWITKKIPKSFMLWAVMISSSLQYILSPNLWQYSEIVKWLKTWKWINHQRHRCTHTHSKALWTIRTNNRPNLEWYFEFGNNFMNSKIIFHGILCF